MSLVVSLSAFTFAAQVSESEPQPELPAGGCVGQPRRRLFITLMSWQRLSDRQQNTWRTCKSSPTQASSRAFSEAIRFPAVSFHRKLLFLFTSSRCKGGDCVPLNSAELKHGLLYLDFCLSKRADVWVLFYQHQVLYMCCDQSSPDD